MSLTRVFAMKSVERASSSLIAAQTRWRDRMPTWGRQIRASPDLWAVLAIATAVLLANILSVSGIFHPNPLDAWSGLARGARAGTDGYDALPGILGGRSTLDPSAAYVSQALGHLAVHDWFHLRVPWWNPFQGTGSPLAGDMQSAAFSPFTLFTAVSNGQLFEHMLFELISGIATYLLLRRLEIARWASTVAAIVFALNGTFAWFTHAPVNVIPFLPLLLLGIETAYAASIAGRPGGWWLIAVAGALSVYAGFPETAYIDALLAGLWVVWRGGCAGRVHVRPFLIKLALGAVCAALLSAPLLVAFADYLRAGITTHVSGADLGTVHPPGVALPMLLLPYIYGPLYGYGDPAGTWLVVWGDVGGYLSTSLLFFGIVGLVSPRRPGLRLVLLTWIVLSVARIYGVPGLGAVLGVFPGVGHVLFERYADPALEFAVIVLAALGMDTLSTRTAPRRLLAGVTLVSLAAVGAAVVRAQPYADTLQPASHSLYQRWSVIWAVAVIAVGALATIVPRAGVRRILVAAIVSVDAFALFVLPELSAPRSVTTDIAPVVYLQKHQGLARFATVGPLYPNYGSYFGLRAVNDLDAVLPKNYYSYAFAHLNSLVSPFFFSPAAESPATGEAQLLAHLNGYRAAGVRYVLTNPDVQLPVGPRSFKLVFRSPTTWIYRLAGASPYFTSTNPLCSVRFKSDDSARLSCPGSTTLVRRETYMPGWSASADGRSLPIRQDDGIFQAVTVGPGSHRVTFAYTPPHMELALLAMGAGILGLLAPPLIRRIRIRFKGA